LGLISLEGEDVLVDYVEDIRSVWEEGVLDLIGGA
jgi:hypothetical protein